MGGGGNRCNTNTQHETVSACTQVLSGIIQYLDVVQVATDVALEVATIVQSKAVSLDAIIQQSEILFISYCPKETLVHHLITRAVRRAGRNATPCGRAASKSPQKHPRRRLLQ